MMTTLFVNDLSLKALTKTKDLCHLKTIVCFDPFTQDQSKFFADKGVTLRLFEEILKVGKDNKKDYKAPAYDVKPDDCLSFCYTSGTTGPPKGAMLSHRNYCSFLGACAYNKDVKFNEDDVVLSYLPLPHVLER